MINYKIGIGIPTYNAGDNFEDVVQLILSQNKNFDYIKIFDSESEDNTIEICKKYKIDFEFIEKKSFSHSATRTKIAKQFYNENYDYLIFMTQDVYLKKNSIENLVKFIIENKTNMAYGRQKVDLKKGNIFEYYSRLFNYSETSLVKSKKNIENLGIKTIFCSDAFAIYDLKKIAKIDFFGDKVNYAEDMFIAHKIIEEDGKIGYCAEAEVFHTHNFSIKEEFRRHVDTGKFHSENKSFLDSYTGTSKTGIKLVLSEINFLVKKGYIKKIPESIIRNGVKFLGFKYGYIKNKK